MFPTFLFITCLYTCTAFLKQLVKTVCVKEEHFVRSAMIMNAINEKLKAATSQGISAN